MADDQVLQDDYFGARQKRLAEANRLNRATVLSALAGAGITEVTVEFDGSSDDGFIGEVLAHAHGSRATMPTSLIRRYRAGLRDNEPFEVSELHLAGAIEELCWGYLEEQYDGWENNEGAFGEFRFHVSRGTIEIEINQRVVEVETHRCVV